MLVCAYSQLTYLCAYFKANYPVEFFCALLTVQSQGVDWAQKAPLYVQEAKTLGVTIHPPSVQVSDIGFTIQDNDIYFGLNAIRAIGTGTAENILACRDSKRFTDIWDFLERTGSKVNARTFEALIISGAFDSMGYKREDLLSNLSEIISYLPSMGEYRQHLADKMQRDVDNAAIELQRLSLDTKTKEAKALLKAEKKAGIESADETKWLAASKESLKLAKEHIDKDLPLHPFLQALYEKYGTLRKLPTLRDRTEPIKPELKRYPTLQITVEQLMQQAHFIGCYLGIHPARVIFPEAIPLIEVEQGSYFEVAGQVTSYKEIITKRGGQKMAIFQIGDGTAVAEVVLFPNIFTRFRNNLPEVGNIIWIRGVIDSIEPLIKIIPSQMKVHMV